MALHNNKKVNVENVEVKTAGTATGGTTTSNTPKLGKLNFINGFMKLGVTSEYVAKFKEVLEETFKNQDTFNIKLFTFDNQNNAKSLAYSFVIVAATRNDVNKVWYMPFLLEATGREPVAISSIFEVDPTSGVIKLKDQSALIAPCDYFSDPILTIFENDLKIAYPGKEIKYLDGEIIPHNADLEKVGRYAAVDAHRAFWIKLAEEIDPDDAYIAIEDIMQGDNVKVIADLNINTGLSVNQLDRITATDYVIKTQIRKKSEEASFFPMLNETVENVGSISGYVEEALLVDQATNTKRAIAVIINNEVDTPLPTLEHTLLNIANSTILNQHNILLNLLYNKDNIGAMNFLVNLEGNDGFGAIVNLKDKKYTYDKALMYLNKLFMPKPAMAVEVELNGREYFKVSPFAALINPAEWADANEYILQKAEDLTGMKFQSDTVFKYAIEIPVGEWVDQNGNIRDLREIDTATIIALTKDINLIHKWLMSNEDPKITGLNPLVTKLEVYNKLGLNARFVNKAVRVYLNPQFVEELVSFLSVKRYNPIINSNITYSEFTDLSQFTTSSIAGSLLNATMGVMPGWGNNNFNIPNIFPRGGFFR